MNDEIILAINDVSGEEHERDYFCGTSEGFVINTNRQEIKILIGDEHNCCERWGHFSTNDNVNDFIGAKINSIKLTDTALNIKILEEHLEYGVEDGGIQFVDIDTDRGTLQFAVYNSHNGYYGHAILIKSEQLRHEGVL